MQENTVYNTYSMAGSCYMAYTATCPRGSAPRAHDCISHIALPSMLYLLYKFLQCFHQLGYLFDLLACRSCTVIDVVDDNIMIWRVSVVVMRPSLPI